MPPFAPPVSSAASVPWRSLAVLAGAVAVAAAVVVWIESAGGPVAFRAQFGGWAPVVSVPAHVLTTLTPVGEIIPFGVANGAVYGVWTGAALNWTAWMVAAVLQYRFGRSARREAGRLPRWTERLPLTHPVVLTVGRWLPGGGPLVDAAAGAAGVPLWRAMAYAAVGHAPQAVAIAAVGAGLLQWV